jgi:hypothetical protein
VLIVEMKTQSSERYGRLLLMNPDTGLAQFREGPTRFLQNEKPGSSYRSF